MLISYHQIPLQSQFSLILYSWLTEIRELIIIRVAEGRVRKVCVMRIGIERFRAFKGSGYRDWGIVQRYAEINPFQALNFELLNCY
jgi:hypothetical protein